MLAQLYYLFIGIQKPKKQLTSLDMVEFIICKYYQIIGCHNNWIIINVLDYGTDK